MDVAAATVHAMARRKHVRHRVKPFTPRATTHDAGSRSSHAKFEMQVARVAHGYKWQQHRTVTNGTRVKERCARRGKRNSGERAGSVIAFHWFWRNHHKRTSKGSVAQWLTCKRRKDAKSVLENVMIREDRRMCTHWLVIGSSGGSVVFAMPSGWMFFVENNIFERIT